MKKRSEGESDIKGKKENDRGDSKKSKMSNNRK